MSHVVVLKLFCGDKKSFWGVNLFITFNYNFWGKKCYIIPIKLNSQQLHSNISSINKSTTSILIPPGNFLHLSLPYLIPHRWCHKTAIRRLLLNVKDPTVQSSLYQCVVWNKSHANSPPKPSRDGINGNNAEVCVSFLCTCHWWMTVRNSWNSVVNQNGATTIFVGLFMFFINNIQHIVPLRKFRDFLHFLSPVFLSFSLPYSVPTYPLPLFIRSLCTGGGEMLFHFLFTFPHNHHTG